MVASVGGWATLSCMDEEIKSYLVAITGQLSELKSDVGSLKSDVGSLKSDVAALQAQEAETRREIREHTEAVETRLLTEFWKWARTADARYRQAHSATGAIDDRVQLLEDRVADLERKRAS